MRADITMNKSLSLYELLDGLPCTFIGRTAAAVFVTSLSDNSGKISPGTLFIALCGKEHDGHAFLDKAIAAGASALLIQRGKVEESLLAGPDIAAAVVDDTRALLLPLVQRFYRNPSAEMTMVGITGTNGKTTVSYLLEQALVEAGMRPGVIGTIDYRYWNRAGTQVVSPAALTTPDLITLNAVLREMADSGVTHVIMEVSSHALAQQRLGPILFDLALFTNLSQDHLDYHRTMAEYFAAKCLLFEKHMAEGALAVVVELQEDAENGGFSEQLIERCRSLNLNLCTCGTSAEADFRLDQLAPSVSGVSFRCTDGDGSGHLIESDLIGSFNAANLLAAFVCAVKLGAEPDLAATALSRATGAPGRLQPVELADRAGGQPMVIVDYAHTPDALEKVLQTLKELEHRNLFCVVGCGGDRDKDKRALMGEIAARLADVVMVTDDNPRKEVPAVIRSAIISGINRCDLEERTPAWLDSRGHGERGYLEYDSRFEAIEAACTGAGAGDIVLIAGKGHEKYQIFGTQYRFFDDALAARQSSLKWDLKNVAAATGGTIVRKTVATKFRSISTDSRTVGLSDVFVALTGELFDGHDFLDRAIAGGAGCLVVSETDKEMDGAVCVVEVADTLSALGDLAAYRRRQIKKLNDPVVVGLTGSCGKTTVKEMTAAIFEQRWPDRPDRAPGRVLKTQGNFNNLIGLPLSLLPVSAHHRSLVLEMGMNRPGEIARLTEIADPDICCITNVHQAHLEGLGSIEGVAAAKGELFANSRADAVAVINLDDEHIVRLARRSAFTIGFAVSPTGLARRPQIWAEDITSSADGDLSFMLHVGELSRLVQIQAPGLHNAANACAAAAISHAAGIDFDIIVAGLQNFRASANRMQRLASPDGLNILNDSYNANPASMASGLKTLAEIGDVQRMAILGDMLELGEASAELHQEIGRLAAGAGLSYLALVGAFAEQISLGARGAGMAPERIRVFEDKALVLDWVDELQQQRLLQPGDWLLVKASRGLALDTVVDQLMAPRRAAAE
jgi:murE/murF fusion protein